MTYRLHYAPDNASLIVRLVLEELGADYETVLVDRSSHAHKSPDYLKLNPNGLIPVLETPDGVLFETGAILLWLAERHGAMAPLPGDPLRVPFLTWLIFTANTLHSDLRITFYPGQYAGAGPAARAALRTTVQGRLRRHLEHLDAEAADGPAWLDPEHPTVLCYYLGCLMRWMALYPVDGDKSWYDPGDTPHLTKMLKVLETRPATLAAAKAEGLGETPFTKPRYANPPEGSAI